MARIITPRATGDVVELRGERGSTLTAYAPDGMLIRIPAPKGRVLLWLAQAGTWAYAWASGDEGTILVTDPPETETVEVAEPVEETPVFSYGGR